MVERIEDLNLPAAVVARIIKDALPASANVSKEARAAIARAASVFVIYLTASTTTLARKSNHKTITAKHIIDALEQLEFESFTGPLKDELENHRKVIKEKKDGKSSAKKDDAMEVDEAGPEADE